MYIYVLSGIPLLVQKKSIETKKKGEAMSEKRQ